VPVTFLHSTAQGPYLVGTTVQGGANQNGNIFKWDASGNTLFQSYDFGVLPGDGSSPWGGSVQASNGLFYGLTKQGGTSHLGCIYSYSAANDSEKILYSFKGGADGAAPYGSMIQGGNSLLYGMTAS